MHSTETAKQILVFIHRFKYSHDYSPSMREIGKGVAVALGAKRPTSTSVVSYHIRRMETKGLLASFRNQSRTVHLTADGKRLVASLTKPRRERVATIVPSVWVYGRVST